MGDHQLEHDGNKYVSSMPAKAVFSNEKQVAALGIDEVLGIAYVARTGDEAIAAMRREVEHAVTHQIHDANDEDQRNLAYVLDEAASSIEVIGNNGVKVLRDMGHIGKCLQDFCEMDDARAANLHKGEVAALRYYTTSTFRLINDPLRSRI